MRKILVLENDDKLTDRFASYIEKNPGDRTFIFNADTVDTDVILEEFKNHEVLQFQPTMLTFSQYNLMVMAMYKLMKAGSLGIKEIQIFTYEPKQLESDLRDLWDDKRMYLDQVLGAVKIFQVYHSDEEPVEIKI